MLIRALCAILIAVLAAPTLTGCGATPRVSGAATAPNLVLPGEALVTLERSGTAAPAAWEYGRRDRGMGLHRTPDVPALRYAETRTWDRQWTSNGRPREHSRSFTTTIEQRIQH